MNNKYRLMVITTVGLLSAGLACSKQSGTPTAQPDSPPPTPTSRNEASPSPAGAPQRAVDGGHALKLDGLTLTVPEGWQRGEIAPGPFAAVAVFELTKTGADEDNAQVRITHFPGMKGKDDLNIQRWLGQVVRDDGSSYSADDAKVNVREDGNVRIKMIDLQGSVKATMRATPRPNSRMIAAIVDHPKGPHFVVATGGVATMKKWEATIRLFLDSAIASSP